MAAAAAVLRRALATAVARIPKAPVPKAPQPSPASPRGRGGSAGRSAARAGTRAAAGSGWPAVPTPTRLVPVTDLVAVRGGAFGRLNASQPYTTPYFQLRAEPWTPGVHYTGAPAACVSCVVPAAPLTCLFLFSPRAFRRWTDINKYGNVSGVAHYRVSFSASKKGMDKSSVIRNRARRRLREAVRAVMPLTARRGTNRAARGRRRGDAPA